MLELRQPFGYRVGGRGSDHAERDRPRPVVAPRLDDGVTAARQTWVDPEHEHLYEASPSVRGTRGSELEPPGRFADSTTVTIAIHQVSRRFGEIVALDRASIVAPPGEITVLLGPNGAGKTTAIRLITGALATDVGTVRVFGIDPHRQRGRVGPPPMRGGDGETVAL